MDPNLVPLIQVATLVLLLGAAKAAWHYWHRESVRVHQVATTLLIGSAGCFLLWWALRPHHLWLLLVAIAIGPVAVVLHMYWSWLRYEGQPEEFEKLPPALDMLDETIANLAPRNVKRREEKEDRDRR